jgi:CRISPR/Cas system-associated endonuclease Cas3-HD
MANIEIIFNDPEKAMAIIFHMTNSHEIAVQTITDINKSMFKATSVVNKLDEFLEKINLLQIPKTMLENIEMARDARESFANTLSNSEAERVDYDNYIMEMYSLILEACTIGQQIAASIGNTDEYEIDHLIPNRESFFNEVYDLFQQLATQTKDEVKEYAIL